MKKPNDHTELTKVKC